MRPLFHEAAGGVRLPAVREVFQQPSQVGKGLGRSALSAKTLRHVQQDEVELC